MNNTDVIIIYACKADTCSVVYPKEDVINVDKHKYHLRSSALGNCETVSLHRGKLEFRIVEMELNLSLHFRGDVVSTRK